MSVPSHGTERPTQIYSTHLLAVIKITFQRGS
jgi:hypothetical protein